MKQQPHRACGRTKSKQKENQTRHIQIDHACYCFRFIPQTMQWYH